MKIHILGCGDAFNSGGRSHTAFLLEENERLILVDCGMQTLLALKGKGISTADIQTVIITHFHGDHFGGLASLLLDRYFVSHPEEALNILCPDTGTDRITNLIEVLYPGLSEKVMPKAVRIQEYSSGKWFEFDDIRLIAYKVDHSEEALSHGVRLEWGGKVFSYSGDTAWTPALVKLSEQADVFICECSNFDMPVEGHIHYQLLIRHLAELTCKRMFLTHAGDDVIARREELAIDLLDDQEIIVV